MLNLGETLCYGGGPGGLRGPIDPWKMMIRKQNQRIPQKGVPLYQQIASWLREDIDSEVYPVGSLLPPVPELAKMFGVGKHTVGKALEQLKNGGVISIRRRGGTRVEATLATTSPYVIQAFDAITQYSNTAKLTITDKNLIVARKDVAELLQCPSAQEWLHIEGYRSSDGPEQVVGYTQVFINRAFPKIYERVNKNTIIIFKMFQEIYNESIVEVRQEMRTILIRDKAADVLKVPDGTIGMRYITRFYSAKGEQLEVTVNIHPLDKLNFAQHIVYPRPIGDPATSLDGM